MTRALLLAAGFFLAHVAGAGAASTYAIDQRFGTLGFEIDEGGVFTSKGVFHLFAGTLTLDFEHPEASRIDVSAEAGSADIPGPGAIDMLKSPDYFDAARFARVRFVSAAVQNLGSNRFHIDGTIEIRGVTQPQAFEATLTEPPAPTGQPVPADFEVKGQLQRSRFGMVADQGFISDTVRLDIRLKLILPAQP